MHDDAARGSTRSSRSTPFAQLPARVRAAYLARKLRIVPTPASLVFFEHPGYRKLAAQLPRATQIPLLHLFPRVEGSCAIRIPQSGWLDESDPGQHGHRVVDDRAHASLAARRARRRRIAAGDGKYTDKVSVALFSTDPEVLGLYDKPLARNAEIWTDDYELAARRSARGRATRSSARRSVVDAGGRFGYRMHVSRRCAPARASCSGTCR